MIKPTVSRLNYLSNSSPIVTSIVFDSQGNITQCSVVISLLCMQEVEIE